MLIKNRNLAGLLQKLNVEIPKDIGHRVLRTLIVGIWKGSPGERNRSTLPQHLGGVRLQDGVRVITYQLIEIAGSGGQSRLVGYRTRTGQCRTKAERRVSPKTGEIRHGDGTLRVSRRHCRNHQYEALQSAPVHALTPHRGPHANVPARSGNPSISQPELYPARTATLCRVRGRIASTHCNNLKGRHFAGPRRAPNEFIKPGFHIAPRASGCWL